MHLPSCRAAFSPSLPPCTLPPPFPLGAEFIKLGVTFVVANLPGTLQPSAILSCMFATLSAACLRCCRYLRLRLCLFLLSLHQHVELSSLPPPPLQLIPANHFEFSRIIFVILLSDLHNCQLPSIKCLLKSLSALDFGSTSSSCVCKVP